VLVFPGLCVCLDKLRSPSADLCAKAIAQSQWLLFPRGRAQTPSFKLASNSYLRGRGSEHLASNWLQTCVCTAGLMLAGRVWGCAIYSTVKTTPGGAPRRFIGSRRAPGRWRRRSAARGTARTSRAPRVRPRAGFSSRGTKFSTQSLRESNADERPCKAALRDPARTQHSSGSSSTSGHQPGPPRRCADQSRMAKS
jgi:hypothetical protein